MVVRLEIPYVTIFYQIVMKLCKVISESMIYSYGTIQNHFFSLLFVSLYVESIIIFCFYIYIYSDLTSIYILGT